MFRSKGIAVPADGGSFCSCNKGGILGQAVARGLRVNSELSLEVAIEAVVVCHLGQYLSQRRLWKVGRKWK